MGERERKGEERNAQTSRRRAGGDGAGPSTTASSLGLRAVAADVKAGADAGADVPSVLGVRLSLLEAKKDDDDGLSVPPVLLPPPLPPTGKVPAALSDTLLLALALLPSAAPAPPALLPPLEPLASALLASSRLASNSATRLLASCLLRTALSSRAMRPTGASRIRTALSRSRRRSADVLAGAASESKTVLVMRRRLRRTRAFEARSRRSTRRLRKPL